MAEFDGGVGLSGVIGVESSGVMDQEGQMETDLTQPEGENDLEQVGDLIKELENLEITNEGMEDDLGDDHEVMLVNSVDDGEDELDGDNMGPGYIGAPTRDRPEPDPDEETFLENIIQQYNQLGLSSEVKTESACVHEPPSPRSQWSELKK